MPANLTGERQSVAIVVPNYNHAAHLPQSLASIAAQTHAPDEVLIIDDASTDDSLAVISEFIARHPSWQLIKHPQRLGVVAGQNEAFRRLKADWISCLGADDFLHPTYIEKTMQRAKQQPQSSFICGCVELIGNVGSNRLRPILLPALTPCYISPHEFRRLLETGDNYFVGTVTLFRRQAFLDAGGLDPLLESLADGILARQLAIRGGFFFIPEVLGFWRLHGANFSTATVTRTADIEPLLARVRSVITAEPSEGFPAHYDATLDRRIRFGAGRILTFSPQMSAADRADRIANILRVAKWERAILPTFMATGRLGRIAALIWLTLRTRPLSLKTLLSQWSTRQAIMAATQHSRV